MISQLLININNQRYIKNNHDINFFFQQNF